MLVTEGMAPDEIQMKGIYTDMSVNMADTMVNEDNGGNEKDGNHNAKDRLETEQLSGSIHSDNKKHNVVKPFVVHPSGDLMFYWLGAVTLAVLYNLWTCIARQAFHEIQKRHVLIWFCLDGVADFLYLLDIGVQFRTGFLHQGLIVSDYKKLCKNYIKNKCFIIDIISLVPLDLLQFYIGFQPMLRFPRFLKVYRSDRFMRMYESRTGYPNLLRVAKLSHILFLGSHWFAAFYYLISEAEDFQGDWAYPKPEGVYAHVTRKYLASLYWSTLTLTTIGDLPPPDTNWQYTFVIVSYLIGVFIFATIVGQVGSVITNRNASRQEFKRLLDGAKFYMQMHNVPSDLQKRVQRWYDYVWTRGRLNCLDINSLGLLSDKLKTELALHVNLGTLRKVEIFQKCKPEFLHDLMLKMKAYIFTPEDLICRRGEVAREMFIIVDGVVEILGDKGTVLKQMSSGDFFGEIGILNLNDGDRRTADVRSVGYSELFVLSREDVLAALKEHPDAEVIIRHYGHTRLEENEKHRQQTRSAPGSPDLVQVNGTTNNQQMTNSAEDYNGPLANSLSHEKRSLSNNTNSRNLSFNSKTNRDFSKKSSPVSSAPSIILTQDTDATSSNTLTMSPRKYSIPPCLDLPIDVHPFRRGSVHNTSDIQLCLEGLKFHIENRLDLLEASCKDTKLLLKKSMAAQEQFMTLIMNSINKEKDTVSGSPSYIVLPDRNEMRRSQDLAEHVEKQSIKTNEEDASCNRPTADKYAITHNESGDGSSTVHNIQCKIKMIDNSNKDDPYNSGNSASDLYITHL